MTYNGLLSRDKSEIYATNRDRNTKPLDSGRIFGSANPGLRDWKTDLELPVTGWKIIIKIDTHTHTPV